MSGRKEETLYQIPHADKVREVEEAWKACGVHPRYGKRNIFFIGGRAGVGKTRLAREAAKEYLKGRKARFKEACLTVEPEILPLDKQFGYDTYEGFCDEYDKLVFYNEPGILPGMGNFVEHDQDFMAVGPGYLLLVHVNYDLRDGDREAFAKLREYLRIYQDHVNGNGTILVTVRWTEPAEDIYILEEEEDCEKSICEIPARLTFTDRQMEVLRLFVMFPEWWIHTDTIARALRMEPGEIGDLLRLLETYGYVEWNLLSETNREKGEDADSRGRFGEVRVSRGTAEKLERIIGEQKGEKERDFAAGVFGNLMNTLSGEQIKEMAQLLKALVRRLGEAEAVVYYGACRRVGEFAIEKLAAYEGYDTIEDVQECLLIRVELSEGSFYGLHGLQDADGGCRHDLSTPERITEGDILCKTKGLTLETIHKTGGALKIEYVALLCGRCGRKEKIMFRQPEQLCGCRESSIADQFAHGVWTKLVLVQFAEGLRSIGAWAFTGCADICGELWLPEGLREIGDHAFSNCRGFRGDLIIPGSVVRIGKFAFCGGGFDGKLVVQSGQTQIGENAFSDCDSLKK